MSSAGTTALLLVLAGHNLPDATEKADRTVIAFGSCARQNEPQPVWDAIARENPDIFLMIGDNVYADEPGQPATQAMLSAAYEALGQQPRFRDFRRRVRMEAIWDDHDYGVNDGGAEYPLASEAKAAFLKFFEVDAKDPRRKRKGLYHAFFLEGSKGRRVQVILLDTRSFRGGLSVRPGGTHPWRGRYVPSQAPHQTLLGEAQWRWFETQLKRPADVRIIVSSIQVVSEEHGWEKWANLPQERSRLFGLLKKTQAEGLVFLSGDRHKGELSVMDAGLTFPVYDLTSSGLNSGHKRWYHFEKNRHRVATMRWGNNFGVVRIDWTSNPKIQLELRYDDGSPAFVHRILRSTLARGSMPKLPE